MDYRKGAHTKYQIEYHFVWVTKYRYHVLKGDVALRLRELIRQRCERLEVHILRGVVSKDHVHLLVSAPPQWAPSELMRRIKGRTARGALRGVSSVEEALLGPSLVGAWVFLCDLG